MYTRIHLCEPCFPFFSLSSAVTVAKDPGPIDKPDKPPPRTFIARFPFPSFQFFFPHPTSVLPPISTRPDYFFPPTILIDPQRRQPNPSHPSKLMVFPFSRCLFPNSAQTFFTPLPFLFFLAFISESAPTRPLFHLVRPCAFLRDASPP